MIAARAEVTERHLKRRHSAKRGNGDHKPPAGAIRAKPNRRTPRQPATL